MRHGKRRDLGSVMKGANSNISENVLRWYWHARRMRENRLVKRIYERKCSCRRVV